MALSKEQIRRYSRQLLLPELGVRGQERLRDSAALVIGAGGLGSPAALYLAAAGVGRIGIVDHDAVALSNLHRQILHTTADVGRPKTASACERLRALNPDVTVVPIQEHVEAENAARHFQTYDVVLDGSDNISTRYLVNDACVLQRIPCIYGGVVHLRGQVMVVLPGESACLRCVFPDVPQPGEAPRCEEAGVLGAAAGVIGSLMAHEALKLLAGIGELLANRLLVFEGTASRLREVPVRRDPRCAVCGDHPSIRTLQAVDEIVCTTQPKGEGAWRSDRSR